MKIVQLFIFRSKVYCVRLNAYNNTVPFGKQLPFPQAVLDAITECYGAVDQLRHPRIPGCPSASRTDTVNTAADVREQCTLMTLFTRPHIESMRSIRRRAQTLIFLLTSWQNTSRAMYTSSNPTGVTYSRGLDTPLTRSEQIVPWRSHAPYMLCSWPSASG